MKMCHEDSQSLFIKNSNCVMQIGVTFTTVDYAGMLSSKEIHLHATTFVLFLVLNWEDVPLSMKAVRREYLFYTL